MIKLLIWVGRIAGGLGLLLGFTAVVLRATDTWRVGNLQIGTLFMGSVAAMVLGALAYAASAAERDR